MLFQLPNPDIKITFSKEEFAIHIVHFYRSLQQYLPHYAHELNSVFGETWPRHVEYLCPLCLKNLYLTSELGEFASSSFNVDHYPPKSVGGKNTVIVCEPCNNSAGTNFEPELQRFLAQQSYKSGNTKSNFKVNLDYNAGKNAKIFLSKNSAGEIILEPGSHNILNPNFQQWVNKTGSGADKRPFKIEVINAVQNNVCKALVKTAYLDCFGLWGYDFVFSDTGAYLRKVLNDELEYPFPEGHSFILEKDLDKYFMGVNLLENNELKILTVLIPLIYEKEEYNSIVGVLIPNFEGQLEGLLKTLTPESTFNVTKIPHFEIYKQLNGYSVTRENLSQMT